MIFYIWRSLPWKRTDTVSLCHQMVFMWTSKFYRISVFVFHQFYCKMKWGRNLSSFWNSLQSNMILRTRYSEALLWHLHSAHSIICTWYRLSRCVFYLIAYFCGISMFFLSSVSLFSRFLDLISFYFYRSTETEFDPKPHAEPCRAQTLVGLISQVSDV